MSEKTKLDLLLEQFNSDHNVAKEIKTAAREVVIEARSEALDLKQQAEKRLEEVVRHEDEVIHLKDELGDKLTDLAKVREEAVAKIAGYDKFSTGELREEMLDLLEKELIDEYAKRIRENEDKIQGEADKRAREILVNAMQRVGTVNTAEYTTNTIDLPSEEMKGRIIGKDGRNIKSFEDASGVSVEIGEAGEPTVTVSSFDPVKREVARKAMEALVADGRIQPSRIEESVNKAKSEVEEIVRQAGEDLMFQAGVSVLPQEIIYLLGRLKFRSSYGQSMIDHTLEVVRLGIAIATEVGANVETVKKACLLHDIGKSITTETEKGHAEAGAEVCRRYGVSEEVVVAFEGHHTDVLPTVESVVMYLADAISGARPGARKEDYEGYVNRVKELENIANSFKGVETSFAISAGREVRVIVNPSLITDAEMVKLAHDISRQIHEQIQNFPGQIKVNVIRETKATAIAKPKN